ncbi:MAG: hypothetical protein EPGJADBJ_03327 [Saprospiraceae bacterium]|nr:hypothetical protein [Saprospiraceae bacterium]
MVCQNPLCPIIVSFKNALPGNLHSPSCAKLLESQTGLEYKMLFFPAISFKSCSSGL